MWLYTQVHSTQLYICTYFYFTQQASSTTLAVTAAILDFVMCSSSRRASPLYITKVDKVDCTSSSPCSLCLEEKRPCVCTLKSQQLLLQPWKTALKFEDSTRYIYWNLHIQTCRYSRVLQWVYLIHVQRREYLQHHWWYHAMLVVYNRVSIISAVAIASWITYPQFLNLALSSHFILRKRFRRSAPGYLLKFTYHL